MRCVLCFSRHNIQISTLWPPPQVMCRADCRCPVVSIFSLSALVQQPFSNQSGLRRHFSSGSCMWETSAFIELVCFLPYEAASGSRLVGFLSCCYHTTSNTPWRQLYVSTAHHNDVWVHPWPLCRLRYLWFYVTHKEIYQVVGDMPQYVEDPDILRPYYRINRSLDDWYPPYSFTR